MRFLRPGQERRIRILVIPLRRCRLVTVTPGLTALTRTPCGAQSIAAQRVSWSSAALLVL